MESEKVREYNLGKCLNFYTEIKERIEWESCIRNRPIEGSKVVKIYRKQERKEV